METPAIDSSGRTPWRVGLVVVGVTFGVFGLWAAIAPLDSAALAPGVVSVKGSRKNVEHLEGGIVSAIHVKDGETVAANQLLIQLDDTQASAQLEIAQGQLFLALARQSRLLAEQSGALALAENSLPADTSDPRMTEAMSAQQQLFNARREAREGELSVLEQRIEQLASQASGLENVSAAKRELGDSYVEEIQDLKRLLKDGYVDKQRLRELERRLADVRGESAELDSEAASLEIKIGETRLQKLQLEKDFQSAVVDELGDVKAEINNLSERIRALEDQVRRTNIRSPIAGEVVGLAVSTIGEVVAPGESLLQVVPGAAELIVEAQVNPIDIDRVSNGQAANIRFTSFKSQTTPVIEGKLFSLSADAISDANSAYSYYLARVEIPAAERARLAGADLVPGMPVEVLINTGSRTLLQYLTQPVSNALARSLIED
ncbi:MAG: HlyD family type I secretion periplasmic adaptor subunit [Pseudomonadota bacterium]